MSFQAKCWIIFKVRPISYVTLIRALAAADWSFSADNTIEYMVQGSNGLPDQRKASLVDKEHVLDELRNSEEKGELIGIDLFWKIPPAGIFVAFNIPDDPKVTGRDHLYLLCIDHRVLASDREDETYTNRSWYESRILPLLQREGCTIESVEWYEGRG